MGSRGPVPKDPSKLAGHGSAKARAAQMRVFRADPVKQPTLAQILGKYNPLTGDPWRKSSLRFWRNLGEFPTTRGLQAAQWDSLARAVMIDDALLSGEMRLAAEARQRIAKYGVDPDDLMRLRVQIVAADEAEERRSCPASDTATDRYEGLKAVD